MRTIISGIVTEDDLAMADLYGITPTSFITNGLSDVPKTKLPIAVQPLEPKISDHDMAMKQRNLSMCCHAEALIIQKDTSGHLLNAARNMRLAIMEA